MRGQTIRAIEGIGTLTATEWETIRIRALNAKVGGYGWDEAWLAARIGHNAGFEAQRRATEHGASIVAAAAVAGAVAAIQAANLLSTDQYRMLTDPVGDALGRLRPEERAGRQRLWRSSRLCPIAAALYG